MQWSTGLLLRRNRNAHPGWGGHFEHRSLGRSGCEPIVSDGLHRRDRRRHRRGIRRHHQSRRVLRHRHRTKPPRAPPRTEASACNATPPHEATGSAASIATRSACVSTAIATSVSAAVAIASASISVPCAAVIAAAESATEPGASADEDATTKPVRPIVAIGCACVRA